MISYRKFNLIRETFEEYFKTTNMLLDINSINTRSKNKLNCYIHKSLKKKLKEIDKEDKFFQKRLKKQFKLFKRAVVDTEVRDEIKELLLELGLMQIAPPEEKKEDDAKNTTPGNVEKPAKEKGPAEEPENPEEPAKEEAENVEKPAEVTPEEKPENPEQTSKPETPEEWPEETEMEEIDVENDVSE